MKDKIKKGMVVYYAQCLSTAGIFEVLELKIRTVEDNWFVGTEKREKHAYLFYDKELGRTIFFDRNEALEIVKDAEKDYRSKHVDEIDYEE